MSTKPDQAHQCRPGSPRCTRFGARRPCAWPPPGHLSHGPAVRRGRDAWTGSSTTVGASTTWPQAIEFDEEGITRVVANINELVAALPAAVQKCLARFPGVDRPVTGYEGLIVAQECVRDNAARDRFAADYGYLAWFWESTDPSPESYEADYRWLSQVCESVKPSTGAGKLLWHTLWIPRPSSSSTGTSTSTPSATIRRRWRRRRPGRSARGWPNPTRSRNRSRSKVTSRLRRHLRDPRPCALGARLESCGRSASRVTGRHRVREVTARAGPRRGRRGAHSRARGVR